MKMLHPIVTRHEIEGLQVIFRGIEVYIIANDVLLLLVIMTKKNLALVQ